MKEKHSWEGRRFFALSDCRHRKLWRQDEHSLKGTLSISPDNRAKAVRASHGTHLNLQSEDGEGASWEYLPGQIQVQHSQPPLVVTLQPAGVDVFSTAVSEIAVLIKRSNSQSRGKSRARDCAIAALGEPRGGEKAARKSQNTSKSEAVPTGCALSLGWARQGSPAAPAVHTLLP